MKESLVIMKRIKHILKIRDCEDNLIWGNSVNITDKVRLFKFPDRRLVSHYQSEGVYQVPLELSLIILYIQMLMLLVIFCLC